MAQRYNTVTAYVWTARNQLQDMIAPYRYTDGQIVAALNHCMDDISRIRPDIFLDLKYQRPLRKGDTDDGTPPLYSTTDIAFQSDDVTYNTAAGTLVPIPNKYSDPVHWFISGWLQLYDVADTQDQRAQGFMMKFQQHLLSTNAA